MAARIAWTIRALASTGTCRRLMPSTLSAKAVGFACFEIDHPADQRRATEHAG